MRSRSDNHVNLERRALLIAAAAPLLAPGTSSAAMPQDLARAVSEYEQATLRNDVATLARIVADDYMLVNSDTTVQDKASYLADFKVPGFRMEPYVMEQPMLKVWGDTALTGGVFPLSWTQEGRQHRRRLRIAHVWVKGSSRWQITYTQLTRVPETSAGNEVQPA